uniref:migration and invasion-inhibitory protein n=1 Tax=Ciona intestinalis TaxID=7719 RepID=UPI0002B8EEAC|nr:migration and invasion-inhibitory protein [Ciona intestinalis]|eukprot:XP_004226382.1 migration and invasion-inhibitory protein [Ciona intestinalis]
MSDLSHLELREANKNLLDRLRKSQQDICSLIIAAKHSNLDALSSAPLTSTVNFNNWDNDALRQSGKLISEAKHRMAKSPGAKFQNKGKRNVDLPSPVKSPKYDENLQGKYPIISSFLNSQIEKKKNLVFSETPTNNPLLTNSGNNRPYRATDSMKKPKSILLNAPHHDEEENQHPRVTFKSSTSKVDSFCSPAGLEERSSPPLLGYDWIAGVVENENPELDFSDSYLDEINEFRKFNRSSCHSRKQWNEMVKTPKSSITNLPKFTGEKMSEKSPDPSDTRDPRIVNFTINKRLFPVPVDPSDSMEPGTSQSPRYIRVSIPKSALMSPQRLKLIHRSKFTSGADSLALPDHCMMGCQTKAPPKRDPASESYSTLDLRSSMRPEENLTGLQIKSGQVPVPQKKTQRKSNSFLDESYSIQYKLLKMRNQIRT